MFAGYATVKLCSGLDMSLRQTADNIVKKFDFSLLAEYFLSRKDQFAFGEYWGKLMRGGCIAYRYYASEELKDVLARAVKEILSVQKKNGDISAVPLDLQPKGTYGSDVWERRYVLLGLLEYYKTFADRRALDAAHAEALKLYGQIGSPPRTPISETGWAFFGLESASVLDPVMQIYEATGDQLLLHFADEIVQSGMCGRVNFVDALLAGVSPYKIGDNGNPKESIAKAYEMMSCAEGLLLYAQTKKREDLAEAVIRFTDKIIEEEITPLGSGGADAPYNLGPGIGEQWNATASEYADPRIHKMMETCVTVYFMKLCRAAFLASGRTKYLEQIERSYYNLILGALSPECDYFDYFMAFNGRRNVSVNFAHTVGGLRMSCCSANGITGLELFPEWICTPEKGGVRIDFLTPCELYICTAHGLFSAKITTDYPYGGSVQMTLAEDYAGNVRLRLPAFAKNAQAFFAGSPLHSESGYYSIHSPQKGQVFALAFHIPLVKIQVPKTDAVVLRRGNILLARDIRDGDIDTPLNGERCEALPPRHGERLRERIGGAVFVDYASAGSTWQDDSRFRTFVKIL